MIIIIFNREIIIIIFNREIIIIIFKRVNSDERPNRPDFFLKIKSNSKLNIFKVPGGE